MDNSPPKRFSLLLTTKSLIIKAVKPFPKPAPFHDSTIQWIARVIGAYSLLTPHPLGRIERQQTLYLMKSILVSSFVAVALAFSVRAADFSVKLTDVHLCCKSCVKGVDTAVSKVDGVKADADMDSDTVSLTGPDSATVQKAVNALTDAGYFGKSSDPSIKVNAETGAKDAKVQTMKIENLHMCCAKCAKAVTKALGDVPGVTGNTAAKGVTSFTVTGDFNEKDAMAALQKAGLTGHVAD